MEISSIIQIWKKQIWCLLYKQEQFKCYCKGYWWCIIWSPVDISKPIGPRDEFCILWQQREKAWVVSRDLEILFQKPGIISNVICHVCLCPYWPWSSSYIIMLVSSCTQNSIPCFFSDFSLFSECSLIKSNFLNSSILVLFRRQCDVREQIKHWASFSYIYFACI